MGVVGRLAQKLPSVRALQQEYARTAAERESLARENETLSGQRDALARERDELSEHCRRLNGEVRDALERERNAANERDAMACSVQKLIDERDELAAHCARLDREVAERLDSESHLRSELAAAHDREREFVERAMQLMGPGPLLEHMRAEWDQRARLNALHFTNNERSDWDEAEYDATGETNVRHHICTDLQNICQGSDPSQMRILEIGCGAGRMSKPLAKIFGEVHAVDISPEMIRIARSRLAGASNIVFHQNNGMDLRDLPSASFDFALSFIVFQHIPSKEVVEGYVKEVHRVLKPGRLFKFQVQGGKFENSSPLSTWYGVSYTRQEVEQLAARNGFECRYAHGEGTQDFWLWFFRN